jgi:hypothetical protein
VRRFATLALSLSLVLGLAGLGRTFAQDEKKDAPKPEAPKADTPKPEAPKADAAKPEPAKEVPIPKEVEDKLEAARRAVAEAIVAAQDAGLVQTSIDPPPILDILLTGRANDEKTLKDKTGVSPEVFGAWFTGFGKTEGIVPMKDVRIIEPSRGLTDWYKLRADILTRHIKAIRDAKAETAKKDEPKKTEEVKKTEEPAKKDEPKDEVKKDDSKKDEPKKDDSKTDEPKKDDSTKDESKTDEPKKDDTSKDEPK